MRFRLAGVRDLIAAKEKYHKNLTGKSEKESQKADIAMIFICSERHYAAEHSVYSSYLTYGWGRFSRYIIV